MVAKKTADIDKFYKEHFGSDFSDMSAEGRAEADAAIAAMHTYPHLRTQRQQRLVEEYAKDANVLRGLGVYSSYRAGLMPDVDEGGLSEAAYQKALNAGLPADKIKEIVGNQKERLASWTTAQWNRFAHLAPKQDDSVKAEQAQMKMPEKKASDKPMTAPVPQQAAPPPVAAPAPGGAEGAPQAMPAMPAAPMVAEAAPVVTPDTLPPPTGPTNWRKQMLVNGQYVEVP